MNKKKVIFIVSLIAISLLIYLVYFKKPTKIVSYEPSMEKAFIKYLKEDMLSPDEYNRIYQFNEAHKVFEVRKKLNKYYVYIYLYYNIQYNKYHLGSGASYPAVVILKKVSNDKYRVIKLKEPESGDGYVDSIKRLFPDHIAKNILCNNQIIIRELLVNSQIIK
ncbi:hypothetical protein PV797_17900 [Clostridiaceae bacterium M8S5]|nr:hypothetical protein PV797_17900 [Clostridiaceae bacterium M8S5]